MTLVDIKQKRLTLAEEVRKRLCVPRRYRYFVCVHQQRHSVQTVHPVPEPGPVRYHRDLVKHHPKESYDSAESDSLHCHSPYLQKKPPVPRLTVINQERKARHDYELEAIKSLVISACFSVSGASSACRRRVRDCSLVSSARGLSRTGSLSLSCPINVLSLLSASCLASPLSRSSTGASFVVVPSIT